MSDFIDSFGEVLKAKLKFLKNNPSEYILGVDTYDEHAKALCLTQKSGDEISIILAKSYKKDGFEEDVKNISRLFNPKLIEEWRDLEHVPTDKQRIDKLERLTKGYGKGWILRDSLTDRGMRLHEHSGEGTYPTVREAIDNFKE